MISIRSESPLDWDSVRRVIVEAFTTCEFGHSGEADIVDQLRHNCPEVLSLVATDGEVVVGHILFSPVSILITDGEVRGMGLAPMAVAPDRQRVGIGTALVESGLQKLSEAGCPFVVVLGHPLYYPRFGFVPAAQYGISHGFVEVPQNVFFIKVLDENVTPSISNGQINYRPEFGPQRDDI